MKKILKTRQSTDTIESFACVCDGACHINCNCAYFGDPLNDFWIDVDHEGSLYWEMLDRRLNGK